MTEANGKGSWFLIASVVSVLAVMVAGGWQIISLKIENAVAMATADRNAQLAALKAEVEGHQALMAAKLVEIETQFRSEDQLRNVQWADQMRVRSLMWKKVYGEDYPVSIQFFPSIAQPQPAK